METHNCGSCTGWSPNSTKRMIFSWRFGPNTIRKETRADTFIFLGGLWRVRIGRSIVLEPGRHLSRIHSGLPRLADDHCNSRHGAPWFLGLLLVRALVYFCIDLASLGMDVLQAAVLLGTQVCRERMSRVGANPRITGVHSKLDCQTASSVQVCLGGPTSRFSLFCMLLRGRSAQ